MKESAESPAKPGRRQRPPASLVPCRADASVEIRRVEGVETEQVRKREALEGMCELEFPYPRQRFEGRGIVICAGGAMYFPYAWQNLERNRQGWLNLVPGAELERVLFADG